MNGPTDVSGSVGGETASRGPRPNLNEPQGGPPSGIGGPPPGIGGPPPGIDEMTGALNAGALARAVMTEIIPAHHENTALWYADIRNFRSVNPKYGIETGNSILRATVRGIRETLAHDMPVARLGADRFVFVTTGFDLDAANDKFADLVAYVENECEALGVKAALSLITGVYYLRDFDYERPNFNRALDYTSIAHRNARGSTTSILVPFTDEDLEKDNRRITIEQTIDAALASGQIEVWYQPQIDYTYAEVVGAEALARWNHPELGWISPAEFIPVLENCGKIHDLDLYVWEEACRSAGRWRAASDGKPVPISVNVSRMEMFEEGLMEHFLELQDRYNLPDGSLRIEVTESAFVEDAGELYKVIDKMRTNRMLVEMDDFGSGLSSLNMLKDVPVDVVKLDMGFMRSTVNQDRGGVVLGAVIRMLQGLDTPIIAEGVETLEQAEILKNMGCHLMQGFHFSRPMPLDEFESYLASNAASETSIKRSRRSSKVDDITSFDAASSFLFNNAIGPTMFFFAGDDTSESILVNDEFYEACGLKRDDFGDSLINPIHEIDEQSRSTMWRAASEAREYGAALCHAKVRLTGRWIDAVMRFLGDTTRGDMYSLNIYRWGNLDGDALNEQTQIDQDAAWAYSLFDRIMPSGFVKCALDEEMTIDYVSPRLMKGTGLTKNEFTLKFHNSFAKCIIDSDRDDVVNSIREGAATGGLIECDFKFNYGFCGTRGAKMFGRTYREEDGSWMYAHVILRDVDNEANGIEDEADGNERVIPFDYDLETDTLVIRWSQHGEDDEGKVIENWIVKVAEMPESITPASAAKVLATIRDLRHHPTSGFTDIKCNLRGDGALRWFHINYTCDADENGDTTVVHGYAQDANDQMGSAKWWRRQAEIDQLTGLLNRNAVEQDINLAMRMHGAGMMFMIDLDGFKRVNDEFGHLVGDGLLREIANTLGEHFREGDVLGRYGGDEFVAFVPVSSGDPHLIAMRRSADIIEAVKSITVPDGSHAGCSVGVAISKNREATFYDLLEAADQAMYKSKVDGKGSFTLYDME